MASLRIVEEDPTTAKHSRRILQSEWGLHRAFLEQLHEQGATREHMVNELYEKRNFSVSKNRLDSQMLKWGLGRYRTAILSQDRNSIELDARQQPGLEIQPGESIVTSVDSVRRDAREMSNLEHSDAQDYAEQTLCDGPSQNAQSQGAVESHTLDRKTVAAPDTDEPDTVGDGPVLDMDTDFLPLILKQDLYTPCARVRALHENLPRVMTLAESAEIVSDEGLRRMNQAGAVLYTLGLHELAFDFFFLVLRCHNMRMLDVSGESIDSKVSAEMFLAVLNCARSARSQSQRRAGKHAIKLLLAWLDACETDVDHWLEVHDAQAVRLAPLDVWRYLHTLQSALANSEQDKPDSRPLVNHFEVKFLTSSAHIGGEPAVWTTFAPLEGHFTNLYTNLQACPTTLARFFETLKSVNMLFLRSDLMTGAMKHIWQLTENGREMHLARFLACLLLHGHSRGSTAFSTRRTTDCRREICPCMSWQAFALSMAVVLVEKVCSQTPFPGAWHLSEAIADETARIKDLTYSSYFEYYSYLERCLHIFAEGFRPPESVVGYGSDGWIFEIVINMAGLATAPSLAWPKQMVHALTSNITAGTLFVDGELYMEDQSLPDVVLSSTMLRWSASDTSSIKSFRLLARHLLRSRNSAQSTQLQVSDLMSLCSSSEKLSLFGGQVTLSSNVSMRDSIAGAEQLKKHTNGSGSLSSLFSRRRRSSADSGYVRRTMEISAPQLQSSTNTQVALWSTP
jgi:hypothetical protein